MDKLMVALCEDSTEDEERVKQFVEESSTPAQLVIFSDAQAFIEDYTPGIYHLILMDIYLNEPEQADHIPQGIETMIRIRKMDPTVPAMFITSSKDYALDGYRLNMAGYLEKPVCRQAIEDALSYAQSIQASLPGIVARCDGKDVAVPFSRIVYLEQDRHYVLIHTISGEPLRIRGAIDAIADSFDPEQFIRPHKSFLANLAFVDDLDRDMMALKMHGGGIVQVRRRSWNETKQRVGAWLVNLARVKR